MNTNVFRKVVKNHIMQNGYCGKISEKKNNLSLKLQNIHNVQVYKNVTSFDREHSSMRFSI